MTAGLVKFDELAPQQFESLVRHLVYGFRPWRSLEGEGLDLRAVELVAPPEDGELAWAPVERPWRIVGRRVKSLTTKVASKLVQDAASAGPAVPYGLLVAVSANASKNLARTFHDEAGRAGVREAHLWTRETIEEALLLPENDPLLFTYFGVSLHPRRLVRVRSIRHAIAQKRELLSAFEVAPETGELKNHPLIVRSAFDDRFPAPPAGEGATRSWHYARAFALTHDRLGVEIREWLGVRRRDGTWDRDDVTGDWTELPGETVREEVHSALRERKLLEELVPKEERARIVAIGWIPLSRMVAVDPVGMPGAGVPHLYCDYTVDTGPYAGIELYAQQTGWTAHLDEEQRDPSILSGLRARADLSDEAYARYRERLFG